MVEYSNALLKECFLRLRNAKDPMIETGLRHVRILTVT